MVTLAPKGRQNVLPPLRGLTYLRLFTGVLSLPVLSTPLWGYTSEMCIKSSLRGPGGIFLRFLVIAIGTVNYVALAAVGLHGGCYGDGAWRTAVNDAAANTYADVAIVGV